MRCYECGQPFECGCTDKADKALAVDLIKMRNNLEKDIPRVLKENGCAMGDTFKLILRECLIREFDKFVTKGE